MHAAVIGMGNMGRAMAGRLLEQGFEVTVWNRTPGRAGELVDAGATEAATLAEAVEPAEVVLLSLANDAAVAAVAIDGELPGLVGDRMVVDASTVSPDTSRRLAAALPEGRMVAAPILAAPHVLRAGGAVLLVGGPAEVIATLEPVWAALGIARACGEDPGAATTFKLLANYLLMGGLALLADAVAAGQALGVDDTALRDFFTAIPVVPTALHNRLDDLIGGDHAGWFTTVLGAKDVGLAADLAASAGVELGLAEIVESRYREAAYAGWDQADLTAIIELLR